MLKINAKWKTLIEYAIKYALIFAAVIITPLLAKLVAPLFDWAVLDWSKNGELRVFFTELFTAIFWICEWVAYLLVKRYQKKRAAVTKTDETALPCDTAQTETAETEMTEEAAFASADDSATDNAPKQTKKEKIAEMLKPKTPLLPMKNVGVLFLIVCACILLISIQIGFQVKPFYELGEKVTFSEIVTKIGEIAKNAVKCVWIVALLYATRRIGTETAQNIQVKENQTQWLQWLIAGALLVLFGLYDVLATSNPFAITYLVFYVAFTVIYYNTKEAPVKSFLLIFFVYIF